MAFLFLRTFFPEITANLRVQIADVVLCSIFTSNPLRSFPFGGTDGSESNIRRFVRGSERIPAPYCGAPATCSDFLAELILLSLSFGDLLAASTGGAALRATQQLYSSPACS